MSESRKVIDHKHILAADAVIAEVTGAVMIVDQVEETTGVRGELEFMDSPVQKAPTLWDKFEHGLTWFLIGALVASFWYLTLIKVSGWMDT